MIRIFEDDQLDILDQKLGSAVIKNIDSESISDLPDEKSLYLIKQFSVDKEGDLTKDTAHLLIEKAPVDSMDKVESERLVMFSNVIGNLQLRDLEKSKLSAIIRNIETTHISALKPEKLLSISSKMPDSDLAGLELSLIHI